MNNLKFPVEESIERSKAIECFYKFFLLTFVTIDSHLDKVDGDIYDLHV